MTIISVGTAGGGGAAVFAGRLCIDGKGEAVDGECSAGTEADAEPGRGGATLGAAGGGSTGAGGSLTSSRGAIGVTDEGATDAATGGTSALAPAPSARARLHSSIPLATAIPAANSATPMDAPRLETGVGTMPDVSGRLLLLGPDPTSDTVDGEDPTADGATPDEAPRPGSD